MTRNHRGGALASLALALVLALAGCGGGSEADTQAGQAAIGADDELGALAAPKPSAASPLGAYRLADQATFGATETLLKDIAKLGTDRWLDQQFASDLSR